MKKGKERDVKISLLDLIMPYESGPVLKTRTPDLNRFTFGPGELTYDESDDSEIDIKNIEKKALGLTSVPAGGPYGSSVSRRNDLYTEEDFQSSHTTGFGGPSIMSEEDKPPQNIDRLDKSLKYKPKSKPINILGKKEQPEFFSFLETGKIKRNKKSLGDNMQNRSIELKKLATALDLSGHHDKANEVRKLAGELSDVGTGVASGALAGAAIGAMGGPIGAVGGAAIGGILAMIPIVMSRFSGGKQSVLKYISGLPKDLHDRAQRNPSAVFALGVTDQGTLDDHVIIACYYASILGKPIDTKQIPVTMMNRSTYGVGTDYRDMSPKEIIESEMSGGNRTLALTALTFTTAENPVTIVQKSTQPVEGVPEMLARPAETTSSGGTSGTSSGRTSGTVSKSTSGASSGARPSAGGILFRDTASGGTVSKVQGILGVKQDGIFGPETLKAWRLKTGRTDTPMSPEAALAALTSGGEMTSSDSVPDQVLSAFLVVKEGEVPGLDLSKRSVSMDTISEADEYIVMLGSRKSILQQQFVAAAGANKDAVELALMKVYSQKKGGASSTTATTEVRDIGQFYASPMGIFVSKSDGEIYYTNPQDPTGPKLPLSMRTPDFLTDEEARSLFKGIADPKLRAGMRKYLRGQRQVERSILPRPGAARRMEEGRASILDQSSTPAPPPAPATGTKVTAASSIRKNRLEKMAKKLK